jgi:hypothetical protein
MCAAPVSVRKGELDSGYELLPQWHPPVSTISVHVQDAATYNDCMCSCKSVSMSVCARRGVQKERGGERVCVSV